MMISGPAAVISVGSLDRKAMVRVKTTNMPAGFNYVATMIDLTQTIPSIGVSFNLQ